MKCKICGGELLFQDGIYLCKSCGTTGTLDSIYENIDVCICYEENDVAGRRTKDSIIAQEVYRKLEEKKISTFYERISADGMTGNDLEAGKLAAIHRAKAIIVLGTSVENFTAIETKYSEHFSGKPVIPFCVDVNPGAIPKTLSKIQAMNYSTIGWDMDLVKGVCNILGREPKVDTPSLYGRRKRTIIVFAAIIAAVIASASIIAWRYLNHRERVGTPGISQSQETAESTGKPLTKSEIYKNAKNLLNSQKYLEAVAEFNKIREYKDSSNQIKKIYDRYDGYYQDTEGMYSLYINIIDGTVIEFSFEKNINDKVIKAEDFITLENNCASGKYIDNLLNEGSISISLYDEYIVLKVSTELVSKDLFFGENESWFEVKNKTDRPPIKTVTRELLQDWVTNPISPEDITTLGFELEYIDTSGDYNDRFGMQYRIANTDITIIATDLNLAKNDYEYGFVGDQVLESPVVIAVIAPVHLLCPEKIGSSSCVFTENDIAYVPTAYDITGPGTWFGGALLFKVEGKMSMIVDWRVKMSTLQIEADSKVGIISNKIVGEENYQYLIETHKQWYAASK